MHRKEFAFVSAPPADSRSSSSLPPRLERVRECAAAGDTEAKSRRRGRRNHHYRRTEGSPEGARNDHALPQDWLHLNGET
jgi:hypothetical protein